MKYRLIAIASEESQESKGQFQELEQFCRERGFTISAVQSVNGADFVQVMMEDKYYSDEMKALIKGCQESGWAEGEKICKTSRTIIEAYSKAEKAFQSKKRALDEQEEPDSQTVWAAFEAEGVKNYIGQQILRKVLAEYEKKEKAFPASHKASLIMNEKEKE